MLAACGTRTGLTYERFDAGRPDAPPPECAADAECDDRVPCSEDRCVRGRCENDAVDARCEDDLFCTGPARCDPTRGCVSGASPCGDGVECTEDRCDEERDLCRYEPRRDRCPISHRCDLERGCVARALVHDTEALYEVDLPSGAVRTLAPAEIALTDIALHPDGRAFGVTQSALFSIDEEDGSARWIAALPDRNVALDVHPDGALVAAGRRIISRVDPDSGASEPIARFPGGWSASGDIAFVQGRMLITGTTTPGRPAPEPDVLFEVPAGGGPLTRVGEIGFSCVWGLAPFGDLLYGFDCQGQLLRIDAGTGRAERIAHLGMRRIGGAAAR